ncbi:MULTISPECIES: MerR family transcriptional regulator [Actinoalloteichus]|uniref:MerR family transcriptional regulator n=1 Tax=Actinoalloteichus TaxID=65496 RepID=UPI001E49D172|nr:MULTISPECIES: MerR family transcriptional regulator [Actinoalloteichus]
MPATTSDEPTLTVAAVARRLGVAPATLRTWDRRYGLGPSGHTSGRHRRYGPLDVARLELMQHALLRGASPAEAARYALSTSSPAPRVAPEAESTSVRVTGRVVETDETLPQPPRPRLVHDAGRLGAEPGGSAAATASSPQGGSSATDAASTAADGPLPGLTSGLLSGGLDLPSFEHRARSGGRGLRLPGASSRARGLGRAVTAMDSWSVNRLLLEALHEDGVLTVWQELAEPVLAALNERWEHSGEGREMTRLLSECLVTVMSTVTAGAAEPRTARSVLLVGAPGESHGLPMYVLAAELSQRRLGARLLGVGLPMDGVVAAVRRVAPAAMVLWAQRPRCGDPGVFEALPRTRQRVRLFAGGPGWDQSTLPSRVEAVTELASAVDLIERTVVVRGGRG